MSFRPLGMTLVELLVVLAIVGTVATLVAPAGYRQVERARAQAEWATVEREMESISKKAFFRSSRVRVDFDGASLRWVFSGGETQEIKFRYVFFENDQKVSINANGVASPDEVSAWISGSNRRLQLNRWLREAS